MNGKGKGIETYEPTISHEPTITTRPTETPSTFSPTRKYYSGSKKERKSGEPSKFIYRVLWGKAVLENHVFLQTSMER